MSKGRAALRLLLLSWLSSRSPPCLSQSPWVVLTWPHFCSVQLMGNPPGDSHPAFLILIILAFLANVCTARHTLSISRSSSPSPRGVIIAGPCCLLEHCSPCWSRITGSPAKSIRSYPNKIRYSSRCVSNCPLRPRFRKQL